MSIDDSSTFILLAIRILSNAWKVCDSIDDVSICEPFKYVEGASQSHALVKGEG